MGWGGGAYARDENTSVRVCAKNAGGGVLAGHNGTYLNSVTFFGQQTPLHVAASKGCDYTVECLVQRKADISIKNKNGVSVK